MKNQFRERLSFCATMIEMVVGGLILIGCIISGIGLIGTTDISELLGDAHYLQGRMSDACLILIGAELLKMITSYTIDSVVDVMLLAIARQMIVEHTSPQENLLAVLSVGVLFDIFHKIAKNTDEFLTKKDTDNKSVSFLLFTALPAARPEYSFRSRRCRSRSAHPHATGSAFRRPRRLRCRGRPRPCPSRRPRT